MDHFIITSILLIMLVAWIWYTTDRAPEEKVHQETLDHVKFVLKKTKYNNNVWKEKPYESLFTGNKYREQPRHIPYDYFSQPNPELIQEAIDRGYCGATLEGTKTPLASDLSDNKALYFPKSDTLEISTKDPGIYFIVYEKGRWLHKKKEPKDSWRIKSFKDLKYLVGYFNNCAKTYKCHEIKATSPYAADIFPKEQHAEGILLLAQILQLVEAYNKGTTGRRVHTIAANSAGTCLILYRATKKDKAFGFATEERAKAFLNDHRDLLTNFFTKINI